MREWVTVIGTAAPRGVLLIPAVVLAVTAILLRCRRIGPPTR
ncbi:hypothetical protein FHX42_003002 [Saccharopolyspora lacisalsi]|uniref:Uncharacterized protein n=1 Tax=Halosaccharopolyspora lacisalsi TaxID=1000566 RepID=A0A839DZG1_9PSEU|nr:hypothetical protein [Halosaccharopolyspora lacisalsi]